MASANVELVRSIYAAWGRGDFTATAWADPEIEFVIVGGPDPGSWRGTDAMAQGWRQWLGAWDDYQAEADEYRDVGDERVVVFGRMSGRGKTSGATVETEFVNAFDIRAGKVARLRLFSGRGRALADLGLGAEGPDG